MLIEKKEFFNTLHILLFLWISNGSSIFKVETHLNEIYFGKIYFPTIAVPAFHWIHFIMHSSFRRSNFGFGRLENAGPTRPRPITPIFLFSLIKSIPRFKRPTENQIIASIASGCENASPENSGRKSVNRYDRPNMVANAFSAVEKTLILTLDQTNCNRILICGSECICSSVFGLFCMYHFSFPGVLQVIALLRRVETSRFRISWIAWTFEATNSTNWLKSASIG